MLYLNDGMDDLVKIWRQQGRKVIEVSVEESMRVLSNPNSKGGFPASVLPIAVQDRLNKGEQVDEADLVPVPTGVIPSPSMRP